MGSRKRPRKYDPISKRLPGFTWSKNTKLLKTEKALRRLGVVDPVLWTLNLPQFQAADGQRMCPFAGACVDDCYAGQGWYHRGDVKAAYERNLATVRSVGRDPFRLAEIIGADIGRLSPTHVRPHDSGDFFAPWYVEAWMVVATAQPDVVFYAYTKSLPLIPWDRLPPNFRLVQSAGGTKDDSIDRRRPHSVIFPDHTTRVVHGYTNGNESDAPAIDGTVRIGLVYHGQRQQVNADELLRVVRRRGVFA